MRVEGFGVFGVQRTGGVDSRWIGLKICMTARDSIAKIIPYAIYIFTQSARGLNKLTPFGNKRVRLSTSIPSKGVSQVSSRPPSHPMPGLGIFQGVVGGVGRGDGFRVSGFKIQIHRRDSSWGRATINIQLGPFIPENTTHSSPITLNPKPKP